MNKLIVLPFVSLSLTCFTPTQARSQSNPVYIQFSPAAVKGALYKPDPPQSAPHVAILVMHRTSNVMGSLACTELSNGASWFCA